MDELFAPFMAAIAVINCFGKFLILLFLLGVRMSLNLYSFNLLGAFIFA